MKILSSLTMLAGLFLFSVGCEQATEPTAPATGESAAPADGTEIETETDVEEVPLGEE